MKIVNVTEQWDAMQRMFTSVISDLVRMNACCFRENQEKMLGSMNTLTTGWFERHHAGARAAIETAQRICKVETPVDLLREYRELGTAAFDRAMADVLACQQQLMALGGALARPLASSGGENEPDTSPSETRTTTRSKVA